MTFTVSPTLTCILCKTGRLFGLHSFRSHRLSCAKTKKQHFRKLDEQPNKLYENHVSLSIKWEVDVLDAACRAKEPLVSFQDLQEKTNIQQFFINCDICLNSQKQAIPPAIIQEKLTSYLFNTLLMKAVMFQFLHPICDQPKASNPTRNFRLSIRRGRQKKW
jgi:hypothetical protein